MSNRTNKPRWKNEPNERRARRLENRAKNGRTSRKSGLIAKRALIAILWAGALDGGTLLAQSIINETSVFNNRFETFSRGSVEKIARLDGSTATTNAASGAEMKTPGAATGSLSPSNKVEVDLPAPTDAPRENVGATRLVPFTFPQSADSQGATSVELFCSPDAGATWYSYAGVRPEDGASSFLFEAPKPGVYWFALRTRFANGSPAFSSTRAYRFVETRESGGTSATPGNSAGASGAANATETFALNDDSDVADA
ncbi:MAG: hypothetical protein IKC88_02705, partial [Opitutales bacterium]|nr:hypothetical protein [Opitutales bacterium]